MNEFLVLLAPRWQNGAISIPPFVISVSTLESAHRGVWLQQKTIQGSPSLSSDANYPVSAVEFILITLGFICTLIAVVESNVRGFRSNRFDVVWPDDDIHDEEMQHLRWCCFIQIFFFAFEWEILFKLVDLFCYQFQNIPTFFLLRPRVSTSESFRLYVHPSIYPSNCTFEGPLVLLFCKSSFTEVTMSSNMTSRTKIDRWIDFEGSPKRQSWSWLRNQWEYSTTLDLRKSSCISWSCDDFLCKNMRILLAVCSILIAC